jgi:hypothetical protein
MSFIDIIPEEKFVRYKYDGFLTYTIYTSSRTLTYKCETARENIKNVSYIHTIDPNEDLCIIYIYVLEKPNMCILVINTHQQTLYFEISNLDNAYYPCTVFLEQTLNDEKKILGFTTI